MYVGVDGRPVRDLAAVRRLKALAIPPAWTDVWICPIPNGHLQATGRDARGRKQYRYHPRWREVRDETKYGRMIAFGEALPHIRAQVQRDLVRPDLPREKVFATVVRLLETTGIRVGNEEYARENHSFGLTTMRDRHVEVAGPTVRFQFRGKGGKEQSIDLNDRRLAKVVKRCQDLPGYELFQYLDENGRRQTIDSADVNAYLRQITGQDFTAKDFRTWAGTVLATLALQEFAEFDSQARAKKNIVQAIKTVAERSKRSERAALLCKKNIVQAIKTVAERLGNTPTICRQCYVHPAVLDAYLDGSMLRTLKRRAEREMRESLSGLHAEEAAVLVLLQQRLAREIEQQKAA
jgi:DNA topoisomerase-1